jgi:hypothetical protein
MADDEDFTAATGQGLVVSTGILGDLVLPAGAFDPERADEIRELATQAGVLHGGGRGKGGPFPGVDQATRTEFGRPRSSIRLRTWAAMAVARASSLWKRSPSPMTCFQRANWPSTPAR